MFHLITKMAHVENQAPLLAFIQQHPQLATIVGTTVTLKSFGVWVNHGAPLPGYSRLLVDSQPHSPIQSLSESLPSTIPDVHTIVQNDLATVSPHAVATVLARLSPQLPVEHAGAISLPRTIDAPHDIEGSTDWTPLAVAAAAIVSVIGISAFATAVEQAAEARKYETKLITVFTDEDIVPLLQLQLNNVRRELVSSREQNLALRDSVIEA